MCSARISLLLPGRPVELRPLPSPTSASEGRQIYAQERQQAILGRARSEGRVEVTGLAEQLHVTAETVRRDLAVLERHGLVRRVHGGAIPVDRFGFEPALAARVERRVEEKERIAKAALAEVPLEGALLIDAGSTTARLAELLPLDRELTVVTNSVTIAATVASRRNLTLYLLGGRVRARTMAAVGDWASAALRDVFVDVAFLGTNGYSVARGLTTPDPSEAAVKRAAVAAARRCVVLADSSKAGADHFAQFATIDAVDTLVTDTVLDAETAAELEQAGPAVVRA